MLRLHMFIKGFVQGVFFRSNIRDRANKFNVKGWVKNLDDGSLEAIFEGSDKDVKEILEYCKKGPALAKVNNIVIKKEKYNDEFKDFEIRY